MPRWRIARVAWTLRGKRVLVRKRTTLLFASPEAQGRDRPMNA
jgi:hypothetical protein